MGKIAVFKQLGKKAPPGWGLDRQGNPTDDPDEIMKSGQALPMGQHKGSGLSLMIDIMTGVLSGGKFCGELLEEAKGQPWATAYSQTFIAIDIATFIPLEEFQRRVDAVAAYVKGAQLAEGFSEIFVPGEPEERTFIERSRSGIPLPEGTIRNLKAISEKYGVELPLGL